MKVNPTDQLVPVLKRLRLSGVLQTLELRREQAVDDNLDIIEFLYRLLHDELERRDAKKLERRLGAARFEHDKTLQTFEFAFNDRVPKAKLIDLATCNFLDKHENVLLLGPAGVGKSHLAQALGHRACEAGRSVVFERAERMLANLRASRADNSYERKLAAYARIELLILDDLGLRPLRDDEPGDLYEVLTRRYEHHSTIITSNRALEEWPPIFGEPLLASAALDRLLHHAHVLVIEGPSYRAAKRTKSTQRDALESTTA